MKNVISQVKIELIKRGMTQVELAKLMGVSKQHLNAVLHGRLPSKVLLKKIKEWLSEA